MDTNYPNLKENMKEYLIYKEYLTLITPHHEKQKMEEKQKQLAQSEKLREELINNNLEFKKKCWVEIEERYREVEPLIVGFL